MSNLGFHHAMRAAGIEVITTAVGDRYVLEALRERGLPLGGEQSGHVVFTDEASTGDGLLTALHVMACMAESGRSLAELAAVVRRLPQVLINVEVADKDAVAASPAVQAAVAEVEATLGRGRAGAAAPVRHRAARAGDGRGRHPAAGRGAGRPGRRGRRRQLSARPR